MILYKYKLYKTPKTKHLDIMLREACFVWNHALALQRRYYKIYDKYINLTRMQSHFAKRIHRNLLHSQTTQEILQRLDESYQRFFRHIQKRIPKYKKPEWFTSFAFKQGGFSLNGNVLTIKRIKKRFKFSMSRPYSGKIKKLIIKRSSLCEYYIIMILDKPISKLGKTHNGASVGIDFGIKKYMTLSDGTTIDNPQYLNNGLNKLRLKEKKLSNSEVGSNNWKRKRMEVARYLENVANKRNEFQWRLAHQLCRQYDRIFIEDLRLTGMFSLWGRKMADLAHGEFIKKLQYLATKYGVVVHKIDRFYPSSKMCTCGYKNEGLQLHERTWQCPECGTIHNRDLLAAGNILRRGIDELKSDRKTSFSERDKMRTRLYSTISPS